MRLCSRTVLRGPARACVMLLLLVATARADRFADLERATHDSSWRVRLQAAYVLARQHDGQVVHIFELLLADPHESVRAVAVSALGEATVDQATHARIREELQRATSDKSALVRDRASAALAHLQSPNVRGPARVASRGGLLHIAIGGIGSKAKSVPQDMTKMLRELLVREFEKTPGLTIDGEPVTGFLIDSSITTLNRRVTREWVEVSCEISVIVGRLPSKAMVMMTSGGATVQEPKNERGRSTTLEADALEGAVKGAHENLLAYLRAQR